MSKVGMQHMVGGISIAAVAAACSGGDPDQGLGEREAALYGLPYPGATYWNVNGPGTRADVPVCWTQNASRGLDHEGDPIPGASSSSYPTVGTIQAWTREAVENSWGRAANIHFHGWGTCPNDDPPGTIAIVFAIPGQGDSSGVGRFPDHATNVTINPAKTQQIEYQHYALHEFGHALGFKHEQLRPDNAAHWEYTPSGWRYFPAVCATDEGTVEGGDYFTDFIDCDSVMCYDHVQVALSPGDVMGARELYGQKPPRSVVGWGGGCANIPRASTSWGTQLITWPCTESWNDTWRYADITGSRFTYFSRRSGLVASNGSTNLCMNVQGGRVSATSPTPLITWGCGDYENERFPASDMLWKGLGDMCVVVPSATRGAELEIASCGTSQYERWDFFQAGASLIRLSDTYLCVRVPSASSLMGQVLKLEYCSPWRSSQRFDFSHPHQIRYGSGYCFNVLGGVPESGAKVGLWNGCDNNPPYQNEQFHMSGRLMSLGQCVVTHDNGTTPGERLELRSCVSAPNRVPSTDSRMPDWYPPDPQVWDIYW